MLAKWNAVLIGKAIIAMLVLALIAPAPLMAQYFYDDATEDEFVDSDQDFVEEGTFDDFEESGMDDFSEGGRFIDEEREFGPGGITISGRRTQLRIRGEREMLPLNSAWGAGTGLLIGAWFALIESGDDRTTQRRIGLGVIFGALLGVAIGMKTLIAPRAPRAALNDSAFPDEGASFTAAAPEQLSLGFSLKF